MQKITTISKGVCQQSFAVSKLIHLNTLAPKHVFTFILLLASILSSAQPYPSRLGRFQVDQKKGCVPLTITLTNLLPGDCTPGKPCVMDYESNNVQQQNQFTHTYTTAGSFKLSVLYQSIGADDITITVDPNPQPNFEIFACSGANAAIHVVDNNYDQYVIDFNNDGIPESILPFSNNILTPPHAYSPAGTYTTSVRGRRLNSADNCAAKTQSFQTINTLPAPSLNTLTSIDNTSIKLDFGKISHVELRLEIAVNSASSFQLLQTLYELNTLTLTNLKLDDNYYCFRLGAYDPCNNATTYSGLVCSDKFSVTAQSDVNNLVWATGVVPTLTGYTISAKANASTTIFTSSTPSVQKFDDTSIICKTNYCYQITNNYSGGGKSISLEKCVTSFSKKIPTAINDVSAVVSTTGATLTWQQDPKFTPVNYSIFRATNGSALTFFQTIPLTPTKFTDPGYSTDGKFCYQINYVDKCDNVSPPGIITCPIRLGGTLEKSNAITLVWSAYKGWKNGVKNYLVEKFDLNGKLIKSTTVTDTLFVDDQPDPTNQYVRYDIKASSIDVGLTSSISNSSEFIKDANLYYPTAFTPNGDNLNDGFAVKGQFISKMNLKIFDRWGALVFATEKNEPWDGHRDGKPLTPATFVWKVQITDLAGRTFTKEGTVALILN